MLLRVDLFFMEIFTDLVSPFLLTLSSNHSEPSFTISIFRIAKVLFGVSTFK
jgi:hypothetical protein